MSILLFCLKESRAVSHDTARAKRDIIKTHDIESIVVTLSA
ncbi:hypothetical protein HMPREF9136_0029 [Prevotella dentalis DSM 3688]|uniref:Uncharacterized protein n=1 Tax=Prevotella dentalis (strain ATCC 49559 / DSM 3688 / JCM 13448 / NCTC 12043 / ES 2772) TaxID=908937 RepID=F9CZK2_PREDD|nr:hypothetical protein HMPREF9136_0029 [Prevotella dentalis DSM 3688]